jgi:hypothetical protein
LADDELLWCRICHELGYEREAQAVEKKKWKAVVRHHVEQERKLVYNWKVLYFQMKVAYSFVLNTTQSINA